MLGVESCPTQIHMLKFHPQVPQTVTLFGKKAFKEVIKLK